MSHTRIYAISCFEFVPRMGDMYCVISAGHRGEVRRPRRISGGTGATTSPFGKNDEKGSPQERTSQRWLLRGTWIATPNAVLGETAAGGAGGHPLRARMRSATRVPCQPGKFIVSALCDARLPFEQPVASSQAPQWAGDGCSRSQRRRRARRGASASGLRAARAARRVGLGPSAARVRPVAAHRAGRRGVAPGRAAGGR